MKLKSFSGAEQPGRFRFVLLLVAATFLPGCAEKQVHARPWQTWIAVKPVIPAPAPEYQPQYLDDSAPDLSWDLPTPPSIFAILRQPVRPRVPAQQLPEAGESRQPTAPSLAPQLSPQEVAAAQSQMNDSVAIAQKNLDATKGRILNANQSDLASKVASFLQESRDAARDGDWTRAKNLAKKAQVLSEELGSSL